MERKTTSGIILTLLLMGMSTLTFNIQLGRADWIWTETIYIRSDGSIYPDTAPILSADGITYTLTDNIVANVPERSSAIVVERDDIVIDGAYHKLLGTTAMFSKGISLDGRSNITVRNLEIKAFAFGIYSAYGHSTAAIYGNNITANSQFGICLYGFSTSIYGNNVTKNTAGISVDHSSENNIHGNNVATSDWFGILLGSSSNNRIYGNNITSNWGGINLSYCFNSSIYGNNITATYWRSQYVIVLQDSSNDTIYHNNMIKKLGLQMYIHDSVNAWDDGYPSGGNYWSDYTARYPSAQELDDSGIWDTPYVIDENNRDNYPLMEPWTPTPIPIAANIDIAPDTLNLQSRGKWIAVYAQLPESCDPANIDASTILLNGTIAPVLDSKYDFVTNASEYLVDYENDGILERMVRFDRAVVASWIYQSVGMPHEVSLTLTGELTDGTPFEGTHIIFVVYSGGGCGRHK